MILFSRLQRATAALGVLVLAAAATALAQSKPDEIRYRNRDNTNPNDAAEGTYPIPYQQPTKAEIVEYLQRIHSFLEKTAVTQVIDSKTGAEITDLENPVATAVFKTGPTLFGPAGYEMGVVHAGMLSAAKATGDKRFTAFTERHMRFLHQWLPYFRKAEALYKLDRANPFRGAIDPRALDDSGSMDAALIRARLAGVGPDLKEQIDVWSDWVLNKQFRFPDRTLARQRPQAESLWADDAYMSIPALAEMGRLTKDSKYFDDAVRQALQLSKHLFVPSKGLYTHGLHRHNPNAPRFFWGRATGWIVVALCDLLDVLPKTHPGYAPVKAQLRAVLRGVAEYQSGNSGLWHQMVDRNDSYLETSASAMFVYGLAHAINQGWISPTTYGSIAQAGWIGLTQKIGKEGQVFGTCVGTTLASDQVYYYNRPTSEYAQHGYGPMLLAGAEMIRLLENPAFEIQYRLRTYHFVPKDGRATSYREHQ
jgi:unsaturated rhamnogalacturonyl hydrolase